MGSLERMPELSKARWSKKLAQQQKRRQQQEKEAMDMKNKEYLLQILPDVE